MTKTVLLAFGLIAATLSSVFAEVWGDAGNMSSVYAEHDEKAFAKVCFDNRLGPTPNTRTFELAYNNVIFQIVIDHGHSKEPDVMTVTPPLGFVSSPPNVSVEEDSVGCVFIMEQLIG